MPTRGVMSKRTHPRLGVLPLTAGCATLLAACGGSTPTAAHLQTPRATPTPTATPAETPPPTAAASLPPSPVDTFKAQLDKVDSSSWEQASLGMKTANTQQQLHTVLASELAALEKYRTGMKALTPPADDQVQVPISSAVTGVVNAIVTLEGVIRKLDADVEQGNQSAFNRDSAPYTDDYDALMKADSGLQMAVQVDAQG